jgi:8-oxo-dGTP diphosphatase
VLWRPGGPHVSDLQVALIHRPKYDDWSFAKGKLQSGEHVLIAAVREAAEETGLTVRLGRRLRHVRYTYGGVSKRVDYWAATADDATSPFTPNREVDRLDWLPVAEARSRLTYQHDIELLAEFSAGPVDTVPLIFLRHASAGSRAEWPGKDEARPLDLAGTKDAADLAGLLRCFGAIRVISSPTERCRATVSPYAQATGVPVEDDAALAVANGHRSSPDHDEVTALATRLAAAGKPVVVCAHRENMPTLLAAASAQLGGAPPAGPPLQKAEFVVLHTADGKLVATERHRADSSWLTHLRPSSKRAALAGCQ